MQKSLFLFLFSLFLSCSNRDVLKDRIPVFVSILPLKYFVERIGADRVDVSVMVKPGQCPATYEPTPKQMALLASSQLYFSIGVPFERMWMEKIEKINPKMKIVDLQKGIDLIKEKIGMDPHIWTSPLLVKQMAKTIYETLASYDPSGERLYLGNYLKLAKDLEDLDEEIRLKLAPFRSGKFFVFHPSLGYFAKTYDLEQISIEVEGKEPGPKELVKIMDLAKREKIKVIFVQKQSSQKNARTIAKEIGGRVIEIDPLAEDYIQNMRIISNELAKALRENGSDH